MLFLRVSFCLFNWFNSFVILFSSANLIITNCATESFIFFCCANCVAFNVPTTFCWSLMSFSNSCLFFNKLTVLEPFFNAWSSKKVMFLSSFLNASSFLIWLVFSLPKSRSISLWLLRILCNTLAWLSSFSLLVLATLPLLSISPLIVNCSSFSWGLPNTFSNVLLNFSWSFNVLATILCCKITSSSSSALFFKALPRSTSRVLSLFSNRSASVLILSKAFNWDWIAASAFSAFKEPAAKSSENCFPKRAISTKALAALPTADSRGLKPSSVSSPTLLVMPPMFAIMSPELLIIRPKSSFVPEMASLSCFADKLKVSPIVLKLSISCWVSFPPILSSNSSIVLLISPKATFASGPSLENCFAKLPCVVGLTIVSNFARACITVSNCANSSSIFFGSKREPLKAFSTSSLKALPNALNCGAAPFNKSKNFWNKPTKFSRISTSSIPNNLPIASAANWNKDKANVTVVIILKNLDKPLPAMPIILPIPPIAKEKMLADTAAFFCAASKSISCCFKLSIAIVACCLLLVPFTRAKVATSIARASLKVDCATPSCAFVKRLPLEISSICALAWSFIVFSAWVPNLVNSVFDWANSDAFRDAVWKPAFNLFKLPETRSEKPTMLVDTSSIAAPNTLIAWAPTTLANKPNKAIAFDVLLLIKSTTGPKEFAKNPPSFNPKSTIVALNLDNDCAEVSVEVSISLNFRCPSSITALTNACRLSKLVKEVTLTPILSAYFLTAGSILVKIPSSSKSSGSSFAAPLTTLWKASLKFLPKAFDARKDTSLNSSICELLNPADKPKLTFCAASNNDNCDFVMAWTVERICCPLSPIVEASFSVPAMICSNSAERCKAKKAAVKAKMFAAAPA